MQLKVENGKIEDGSFVGDGCAISQASADIMLDMIIGRSVDEAKDLAETFLKMIKAKLPMPTLKSWKKPVRCRISPTCRPA